MFKSSSFMVDKPYLVQVLQFVTFLLFKNQLIFRLTHQFLTCEKEKKKCPNRAVLGSTGRWVVGWILEQHTYGLLLPFLPYKETLRAISERFVVNREGIIKTSFCESVRSVHWKYPTRKNDSFTNQKMCHMSRD